MKHIKKLFSLLLVLTLISVMATSAFAATVTVPSDGILKDHSFTAYQVFSGREENGVLSDIKWGNGINSDAFLSALKSDTDFGSYFTDCSDAAGVAKVLDKYRTNADLANRVAELAYANKTGDGTVLSSGENTLADGYYLVVDTTTTVGEGGAYNKALLQVVGNINIAVKTDVPVFEKKVKEDDKYNQDGGYGAGYNDVADYDIGEDVEFRLIGSVPDMSSYAQYKYIFHDTMSDGLTLNEDSIKVYVSDDKAGNGKTELSSGWKKTVNGQTFTVSFTNLKGINGISKEKYIIVEYTARLNSNAVIGLDGNLNTGWLEYSNKPDQSGSGDEETGTTPKDKVIVFTYELDVTKVDGQENTKKLEDAKFVLYKKVNENTLYAVLGSDNKVTGWADTEEGGSTLTSNAEGLFKVIGLDDGTYYLKEITAPAGYNMLKNDITVIINASTENGQIWADGQASSALKDLKVKADEISGTGDTASGIAGITVANNKGATLPETGGMGTTIFYVLGAALVIIAGVLLVSRRRMNKNN